MPIWSGHAAVACRCCCHQRSGPRRLAAPDLPPERSDLQLDHLACPSRLSPAARSPDRGCGWPIRGRRANPSQSVLRRSVTSEVTNASAASYVRYLCVTAHIKLTWSVHRAIRLVTSVSLAGLKTEYTRDTTRKQAFSKSFSSRARAAGGSRTQRPWSQSLSPT